MNTRIIERMNKYRHIVYALLLVGTFLGVSGFSSQSADAAPVTGFNAGNIIDEYTFTNKSSMDAGQIQAFLNSKVSNCDTNGTQPASEYGRSDLTHAQYAALKGWAAPPYTCLKDYVEGGRDAAQIIYDTAQTYKINPQVLVVLLQKEQGLVTDNWPLSSQYKTATGYGCPDTAPCDSQYYGLTNQLTWAATMFHAILTSSTTWYTPYTLGNNFVQWSPNSSCGGSTVNIVNRSTQALYNYTPYQPNAAALAAGYGTGDSCSSYGNRNFYEYFTDWFGITQSNGFMRVISDNTSDPRQWVIYGSIKQHIPDSQTLAAWGLTNTPLITLSDSYISSFSTAPDLDRLMRVQGSPTVYFVDGGKRYRVPWSDMLNSWNLNSRTISSVPPDLYALPQDAGDLSYDIENEGSSTIYTMDGANGSGQTVIRAYQNAAMFHAWEGDSATFTTLATSSGFFDSIDNAIGTTITTPKVNYAGVEYEVANGTRTQNLANVSPLYPGVAQPISDATAKRIPNIGNSTYIVQAVNDPAVYLIDNGVKYHLFSNTLQAWGGAVTNKTYVDTAFLATLTAGADLTGYIANASGQVYLMDNAKITVPAGLSTAYLNSGPVLNITSSLSALLPSSTRTATAYLLSSDNPALYLLDNSGQKRHIDGSAKADAWGSYQSGVTVLTPGLVNAIPVAAVPGTYVSDGTNDYILDGGKKWILPPSLKTTWGMTQTPQVYSDGTLDRLTTAGTLTDKIRDSAGGYYYIRNGIAYVTFDPSIGDAWSLTSGTLVGPNFISSNFPQYMLTRFIQSSANGDTRKFVVDHGNWYSISDAQFVNLGGPGSAIMQADPALAPTTITAWSSVVIQTADGNYYVIDGATKRPLTNLTIRNFWTSNGALSVPVVSNGFANLLPTGNIVERAIKGSSPSIYAAEGGTKRHILYSSTFNQSYAPFAVVSDALLNAMPTGSDI